MRVRRGVANAALLVSAWLRLLQVDLQLRRWNVQRVARQAAQPCQETVSADQVRRAQRLARVLRIAARYHFVPARCLHQSLALHAWLRGEGVPTSLEIGVRRAGPRFGAHAWVRIGDVVLGDTEAAVAPFARLAGQGGRAWL